MRDAKLRFKALVDETFESGVGLHWVWKGAVVKNGHPLFRLSGKGSPRVTFKKASYILWRGRVPKPLHVLRTCREKMCCNPWHLMLGDAKVASTLIVGRGCLPSGEDSPQAKLSKVQVFSFYRARLKGETLVSLAKRFGISQHHAWMLSVGKARRKDYDSWKELTLGDRQRIG